LDYPGVGPEHAYLNEIGRVEYGAVTDREAMDGLRLLCRTEGILSALESAHAVAFAVRMAQEMARDALLLVNLSGRGDKDVDIIGGFPCD
jgi:tryptophan synthase beta chain